jgi:hypothetical protein
LDNGRKEASQDRFLPVLYCGKSKITLLNGSVMKRISYPIIGLLAFFLVLCWSCTDHEPGSGPIVTPKIKTLEIVGGEVVNGAEGLNFRILVEELGNRTVTEYGMVWKVQKDNQQITPTINDSKTVFSMPFTIGEHSKLEFNIQNQKPYVDLFYRAYAILENGTVVYGDQTFDFD